MPWATKENTSISIFRNDKRKIKIPGLSPLQSSDSLVVVARYLELLALPDDPSRAYSSNDTICPLWSEYLIIAVIYYRLYVDTSAAACLGS